MAYKKSVKKCKKCGRPMSSCKCKKSKSKSY